MNKKYRLRVRKTEDHIYEVEATSEDMAIYQLDKRLKPIKKEQVKTKIVRTDEIET